jgi:hypothetical protein
MAKTVTSFLLALSDSRKMRDKYRNPTKRKELLGEWGLADSPLFEPGATEDDFRQAVVQESGLAQVEWWISVDGAPIANPDYDPNA